MLVHLNIDPGIKGLYPAAASHQVKKSEKMFWIASRAEQTEEYCTIVNLQL